MRVHSKEPLVVPFAKGFYGGFKDTYATLTTNNYIPPGYYFGQDVVNDDCGFLRARPVVGRYVTTAVTASSPIAVFKLAGSYYCIPAAGAIQMCTSTTTPTWAAVTSSPSYVSNVNVDFISKPADTTPLALVSTSTGAQYIATVTGGAATVVSSGNAQGLAAQDEGRCFCVNPDHLVYYSTRYDYTSGYNNDAGNEWFTIPEVCDPIASMKNIAGSLYFIQSGGSSGRIYIWKKLQTYALSSQLIDQTCFTQVLGVDDAVIANGNDGISALGGNICFWARGSGLNIVDEKGTTVVSAPIQAYNPAGLDYDCIVATDQRSKCIFCKETTGSTTHVYNMVTGTWSQWNINVTCKGYGQAGGMFGTALTWAPAYVSAYPTSADQDTTIVPIVYTPVIDFGLASREKFLTEIHCASRGITEILVYTRLKPADSFTLWKTITTPEQVTKLDGDHRFGECFLKISGNNLFLIKELALVYDIGDTILEV